MADHISDPWNDVDTLHRDNCWVGITGDDAGIPVVRVTFTNDQPVLVYVNDEVIFNTVPEYAQHQSLLDEGRERLARTRDALSFEDWLVAEVKQRVAAGDGRDPLQIAAGLVVQRTQEGPTAEGETNGLR